MKSAPTLLSLALLLTMASPAQAVRPRTTSDDPILTVTHDGLQRQALVHVPAGYRSGTPLPLIVALHGGGGSMQHMANDRRFGLISLSERSGYIVVFPNGYSRRGNGRLATWNAGECCAAARDEQIDDSGFIAHLIHETSRRYSIDPARIYATGMSNGAMMAYRLACDHPDLIRAVAAVAGTDNTRSCPDGRPVSILHIHAKDDSRVLFEGGAGAAFRREQVVTDFTSVKDSIARWTRRNGCTGAPRTVLDIDGARCERYAPCRDDSEVELCVTDTGDHSWPGGRKGRGMGPSQALSATARMDEFFRRQPAR